MLRDIRQDITVESNDEHFHHWRPDCSRSGNTEYLVNADGSGERLSGGFLLCGRDEFWLVEKT